MPYFVFSVRPLAQYTCRATFDSFREASAQAKVMRADLAPGRGEQIKLMFADSEDQAVDLLCQPRSAGPAGDD